MNPTRLGSDTASFQGRFTPIFVALFLAFCFLGSRLWYLQVIRGEHFEQASKSNRVRERAVEPPRGLILDRHGRILVDSTPRFDLTVVPEHVSDVDATGALLARMVGLDGEELIEEIRKVPRSRRFQEVRASEALDRDGVARVMSHLSELPGVQIEVKPIRHYLHGPVLAHLLGYMGRISESDLARLEGYRARDVIGKTGVERRYEQRLKGSRGRQLVEVDAHGRVRKTLGVEPPVPGLNVILTIDRDLQAVAERALGEQDGAVVAMDPRNGELLTWVSHPSFDPNLFADGIPAGPWRALQSDPVHPMVDRVTSTYPPASTFKIVTALAGLEQGVIDPDHRIKCLGSIYFGGRPYRCWKRGGHGLVNLHDALAYSCDVYFYEVGRMVGVDEIASRAERFGLGHPTGIDLPESSGLVPSTAWKRRVRGEVWFPGQTLSVSIGQGDLLVTPLQAAVMVSTLANGGTRYEPRYVLELRSADGKLVERTEPRVAGRLGASRENVARLHDALVGVVNDRSGTGASARIDGVHVAGKTGTAQVGALVRREHQMDVPRGSRDHAWFVAYAPAEAPEIAVAVFVEHAGAGGGKVGAPIAREVIAAHLRQRGLLPTPVEAPSRDPVPAPARAAALAGPRPGGAG